MEKLIALVIAITLLFLLGIIIFKEILIIGPAGKIKEAFKDIPNVEVVSMKESVSEDYFITTIEVKDRGTITFSGWSVHPDQFLSTNTKPIGVSQIGDCSIAVITEGGKNTIKSFRAWTVLDEEIDENITTIQKAIENYSLIYKTVKSWPAYKEQKEPGKYSSCAD